MKHTLIIILGLLIISFWVINAWERIQVKKIVLDFVQKTGYVCTSKSGINIDCDFTQKIK